jgi:hypothetical protein
MIPGGHHNEKKLQWALKNNKIPVRVSVFLLAFFFFEMPISCT